MTKFGAWLKKYRLVSFGTIAVALFTGLPTLVFFQRIGDNFAGVYPVFNGDALYYQARVREIADGHAGLNHPYFFEHKDEIYPQATGAEYFIYALTEIFAVSAPALQIILDFVLPALIFLLTYLFFKKFSANEYTAVLFPLLLYTIVTAGLFKPINPQVSLPLLLLFLIFWAALIFQAEKKFLYSVLAGLILGLLFLTYFYHWSFILVLIGMHIVVLLLRRSFAELKYHGLTLAAAVLVGVPYWLRIFSALDAPNSAETAARVGLYFSHLPESYPRLAVALVWLGFFVLFARYYKIEQEKKAQFVAVLLIANVLYPNHQLITGVIIENAVHWSWMPVLIFALSAHYMIAVLRRENIAFWKNRLSLLVAAMLLFLPAWRLSTFLLPSYNYQYKRNIAAELQYYAAIFDWINAETKKDSVILADERLMKFIPVYTGANVYDTQYAYNLPGSDFEVAERYLLARFFEADFFAAADLGINNDGRILWSFPGESEKNTHTVAGRWVIPYEPQYSLEKERAKIAAVYNNLAKGGWDISLLKKYRLDYIIWDKKAKPEWNLERFPELESVESIGDVAIYQFKSK